MARSDRLNREIVRLALPALGALIAEPLFLIVDGIMIGHLGSIPLAGLGIASAILQTIVGLMIFLAYSTTPAVARRFGEGQHANAVSAGIDGMWLALGIGAVLALAGYWATPWLVGLFGAEPDIAAAAESYLGISMGGLPAMLIVFAATGLLRGMQDTVTPLWIAGFGFAANAGLNALFIYGFKWGIAGSAAGTVVAQWGMVVVYGLIVAKLARRHSAPIRPQKSGIGGTAKTGMWMLLRTLSLRVALLATVVVATGLGTEELAGYQIVFTIFTTAAFALDALAIAAQALIGKSLGRGSPDEARHVLQRTVAWGVAFGVVVGAVVALASPFIGIIFTGNAELAALIVPALLVLAAAQPVCSVVFVLDGVLIGAGDAPYLALAGALNLVVFFPALLIVSATGVGGGAGLAWLAACYFVVYMCVRLVTLGLRVRGERWMRISV